MAYNKIVYNGATLIDLTNDDTVAADVRAGKQFTGRDGEHTLGTMPERGAVSGTIASKNDEYEVAAGYHNGNGKVSLSPQQKNLLVGGNIRKGVTVMGVPGEYEGEAPTLQTITKSYTPTASAQTENITAGSGYDAIEKVTVTVAAIPYVETANTYGTTVTIG